MTCIQLAEKTCASLTLPSRGDCYSCFLLHEIYDPIEKSLYYTVTLLVARREIQQIIPLPLLCKKMADTVVQVVVSPFLGVLFDNLSSLIQKEFGRIWGVHKEMEKLSSILSTIQCVLDDAEGQQRGNKALKNWLKKLKEAAYDADDVLDEWAFEGQQLESEMRYNSSSTQVTSSCISFFNIKKTVFRLKIGKRIQDLIKRFDQIAEERSKFHLQEGMVERGVEFYGNRETISLLTEPQVYGRDEDKENLVTLLLNNVNSLEDISVCPLLGIGGLGKTTLAQLVYNDERVAQHFEARLWVCVSDDFDVKRLMKAIIASISGSATDLQELDSLQRLLREKLNGKRFLLVLDDVWNDNQEEWNRLKYSLMCGAKGSSIIVTTRHETVASITGTIPAYCLTVLSEDNCWSLFKHRAFGMGNEERPELVGIGKEIVKKCKGVPLAAKALGGMMRFKSEENEWLFVRDSELWDLPQSNENNILPALRLSYNHLPLHLRQCFAYCSIFPKDYDIEKEKLIHLWMANGFVQSKEGMELEDIGNEIFNALLWRSMFQDVVKGDDGSINRCKMHDLVHDLACSIAVNECSHVDIGVGTPRIESADRKMRHLLLNASSSDDSLPKAQPLLRTFLLVRALRVDNALCSALSNLVFLRVLDLRNSGIQTLPIPVSNLKHLRYLDLSFTDITSLPESISSLSNLQVLNLAGCRHLKMLPKSMSNMSSLRHLDIRGGNRLTCMPRGIGRLVHLQTLSIFIVGLKSGHFIKDLEGLSLRGELSIKGLEHVTNSEDARKAKLLEKKNLGSISLVWSYPSSQEHATDVMEGLQPHPNTKRLSIQGYGGLNFPNWLGVSFLPKLVHISLTGCTRITTVPPLGQLPFLTRLFMSGLSSLKSIGNELYGEGEGIPKALASLEELSLFDMPVLKVWSSFDDNRSGVPMFPGLKRLIIDGCPKLTTFPFPLSVGYLRLIRSNEMVLRLLRSDLPRLSRLEISGFDELISFPEDLHVNLNALKELNIASCGKLQSLPTGLENLTALKTLDISHCPELSSLSEGLQSLTSLTRLGLSGWDGVNSLPVLERCSLRELSIFNFRNLKSLSEGLQHLTSLVELHICVCPELEFAPGDFRQLVSLRRLNLWYLEKLISLPEGLQHVSSLEYINISNCSNLAFLPEWLGNLTSLEVLKIKWCNNLKFFPEAMQRLTALRTLSIKYCSHELEGRCKENGEDWHKISHIPEIIIIEPWPRQITRRQWFGVGLQQLRRNCFK